MIFIQQALACHPRCILWLRSRLLLPRGDLGEQPDPIDPLE